MSSSNSSRSKKRRSNPRKSSDSHSELLPHRQIKIKKPKRSMNLELDKDILCNQTASGLRLAHQVFSKLTDNNAVMSPLSIHIALSMVAAGAAGHVKEEIVSFIGANSDKQLHNFASIVTNVVFSDSSASGGPKLSAANAVWLNDSFTFKSPFKQTVETDYNALTKLLDFTEVEESVRVVNEWVEEATNGLIKDIVSPDSFGIPYEIVLLIANALYFNGAWVDPFDPDRTKHNAFFRMDESSVDVPFMSCWMDRAIATYDTFKVLNLPYCQGECDNKRSFSMSIFLPNDRDGLPSLFERVCTEGSSSFLNRHIPKTEVKVGKLRIPKFKIQVNFKVLDALKQLGLEIGDLTEMVEEKQEPVIVSKIVHKAFVEVNEVGTEAAAVTMIDCDEECDDYDSSDDESVDFVADHPFMFVIREDSTGLVLFVGRVLDPSS